MAVDSRGTYWILLPDVNNQRYIQYSNIHPQGSSSACQSTLLHLAAFVIHPLVRSGMRTRGGEK